MLVVSDFFLTEGSMQLPSNLDVETLRFIVRDEKSVRGLKRLVVIATAEEAAAKSPQELRQRRAVRMGLQQILEMLPHGGILYVTLQLHLRTAVSRQPLTREEQSAAMASITERMRKLMKAEQAARRVREQNAQRAGRPLNNARRR